ncbi:hypothetical protein WGT02_14955 [Rhizobium sp. T1470]|uniref:hypothetical protein n=1 Tax=unclassified Rhizobium TaxID=2613769 RepID=UPI001AC39869|nr:hypothetical protein [Rhizobium sp. T1473]MCA0802502.1 hypothetical protein [Rhizobium sp. T1473]
MQEFTSLRLDGMGGAMVVDILEQLLAGQFLEHAHGARDAPVAVSQAPFLC